jgi:dTMP kinase
LKSGFPGRRGRLFVVEGIDGTGKSTLAAGLHGRLVEEGYPAVLTFEPTNGPWGSELRESFSRKTRLSPEEELELFVLDRKEHVERVVRPALDRGEVVVCDRYYFSTIAYQGARGLDVERIRMENEAFAPVPDLVILLQLTPESAVSRIREKRGDIPNNFEQLSYLRGVAAVFDAMDDPFIVRLDAAHTRQRLLDSGWRALLDYLP